MNESKEIKEQRARVEFHRRNYDRDAFLGATERLKQMLDQAEREANPPK